MKPHRQAIWRFIAGPMTVCGLFSVAIVYWVSGNAAAAALSGASCIAFAASIAVALARAVDDAGLRIRHGSESHAAAGGLFASLVSAAMESRLRAESASQETARSKTELEAKLHLRQRLLRQLEAALNHIDEPVLIADARNHPVFLNAAAAPLFIEGASREAVAKLDKVDLDRIPAVVQLLSDLATGGARNQRRSAEFTQELAGGPITCEAMAIAIRDGEHLIGTATIFRDVTGKRREQSRHAEFVASVCHELKTPMAGIRAFTEMLIDGDVEDPDEQKQILGFIDVQVDRLARLADNMLNFSRIESGVIKIQREDCELNDILQKAFEVVQPAADAKSIVLTSELSDLYLPVHVDRDLFLQAIINLLSNAVKYTPNGGSVKLRSRMYERDGIIDVSDTGMGIPPASMKRIFERFYRVPENNQAAEGTGLGLSLVHYIITELHNGRIDVESEINKGSCFTITVPLGHREQARRKTEPAIGAQPLEEPRAAASAGA
ncbi:MAG: sensor histidine kinase [Planctomycetaceae bacterium]